MYEILVGEEATHGYQIRSPYDTHPGRVAPVDGSEQLTPRGWDDTAEMTSRADSRDARIIIARAQR